MLQKTSEKIQDGFDAQTYRLTTGMKMNKICQFFSSTDAVLDDSVTEYSKQLFPEGITMVIC